MQMTAETVLRTAARISHRITARTDPRIPARIITGTATEILQRTAETALMTVTTAAVITTSSGNPASRHRWSAACKGAKQISRQGAGQMQVMYSSGLRK